jgi:hypothetical protein
MRDWAFAHQCQALAIVMPNKLKKKIYQTQTGEFGEDKVAYFFELAQACEWLTGKGFAISVDEYPHQDFIARTKPA